MELTEMCINLEDKGEVATKVDDVNIFWRKYHILCGIVLTGLVSYSLLLHIVSRCSIQCNFSDGFILPLHNSCRLCLVASGHDR